MGIPGGRGLEWVCVQKRAHTHFQTWFIVFLHCDIIKLNYFKWASVSDYGLSEWEWCMQPFLCMEVQWSHAIQQQKTHPPFGLFTRQKKKKLSIVLFFSTFVSNCIALLGWFYSILVTKKNKRKKEKHMFHKLLAWCSHSYSNHVHRGLVERERALLKP